MIETQVAKRYAKSLLDLAKEKGNIDDVNRDMQLFSSTCANSRELSLLLSNPIIKSDTKLEVLRKLFSEKMNKLSIAFFEIVTKKGREKYLENIAKEYSEQFKLFKGIRTAEITTAIGLDENLRAAVYKLVRENTNSDVELNEKVDRNLIGGFILRMGDKQYDASISSELRKLAREFSSNPYISKN
ncbi:MAG: ATP synthase F1 subunit delta [Bacteroidetes bacterium]|nr:MAG: ATP synthase F1 subunit delta [Bacteroidota bacterium]REK00690.1 MAG: ATP synthase F1 subunit delta [Bacteroidota bacterium]REK35188.1 MAG: ATP synthase F1 subunit delta [Bacteroidota bacterium]REK48265.1 MAG: ATP synthase F1 subunit delta [Bacteroidota bacterium]